MAKQNYILIGLVIFLAIGIFITIQIQDKKTSSAPGANSTAENQEETKFFAPPVSDALARITKKPFGIYISPQNSPVSPEKFTGYHTGTDFETLPTEQNEDISIVAICDGKLLQKKQARGYGGMVVQECSFNKNSITVVYGHLKLSSVEKSAGEFLKVGEFLSILGQDFSAETDSERKHLHLGIHKGKIIDTRGYVQTKDELKNWIDIREYLK